MAYYPKVFFNWLLGKYPSAVTETTPPSSYYNSPSEEEIKPFKIWWSELLKQGTVQREKKIEDTLKEKGPTFFKDALLYFKYCGFGKDDKALKAFLQRLRDSNFDFYSQVPPIDLQGLKEEIIYPKIGQTGFGVKIKRIGTKITKKEQDLLISPKKSDQWSTEIAFCRFFDHPNVMSFLKAGFESETKGFAYYAWMDFSVRQLMEKKLAIGMQSCVSSLLEQFLLGLQFLHEAEIVHRDLKPENLFVNENENAYHLKIADFGITTFNEVTASSVKGSDYYRPPEFVIKKTNINRNGDIYTLGLILFEMVICPYRGQALFGSDQKRLNSYKADFKFSQDFSTSVLNSSLKESEYSKIISEITVLNPDNRPCVHQIIDFRKTLKWDRRCEKYCQQKFVPPPQEGKKEISTNNDNKRKREDEREE